MSLLEDKKFTLDSAFLDFLDIPGAILLMKSSQNVKLHDTFSINPVTGKVFVWVTEHRDVKSYERDSLAWFPFDDLSFSTILPPRKPETMKYFEVFRPKKVDISEKEPLNNDTWSNDHQFEIQNEEIIIDDWIGRFQVKEPEVEKQIIQEKQGCLSTKLRIQFF